MLFKFCSIYVINVGMLVTVHGLRLSMQNRMTRLFVIEDRRTTHGKD